MKMRAMMQFSRRQFLAAAGATAGSTLLALRASKKVWAAPSIPPAGIQLYTVNEALTKDPRGTLATLAAIGYREVETAGFANLSATDFRKLLDESKLHCPSAHLYFGFQETRKLLDDANTLGVQYVVSSVLPPSPPTGKDFAAVLKALNSLTLDDFKKVAQFANKIGEQAKQAGLQYAYHNHNFEFRDLGNGQTGYSVLLKETDPGLVKFEADCGWMITAGVKPVEFLRNYPARYAMIHVKDFTPSTHTSTTLAIGTEQHATELGRGHIDYKPILAAARKAGVEHFFVEQDPPMIDMTALDAAKVDYEYLHPLLMSLA
jgi:sugar phosphate isomerase/epimerase